MTRNERVAALDVRRDEVRANGTRAPWAVAADGLHSTIRAGLGLALPARRRTRFGIRRHFAVAPWSDRVEVVLARGAEAYVTPLDDALVGVAILFEGHGAFDPLLRRFPSLLDRLRDGPPVSAPRGAGPLYQRVRTRRAGRVLLVGDAAGYVDALTGEGIALGLATGIAAVEQIVRGTPERYEGAWRALAVRPFRVTAALLGAVRHRALHGPLIAAARALPSTTTALLREVQGVVDGPRAPGPISPSIRRG